MVFVTDTHALVWARTQQKRKLGKQAREAFEAADRGQGLVYVSVITLVELEWMEGTRKYEFKESLEKVVQGLVAAPGYDVVPLTAEILLRSRKFRDLESMDRLIVATAEELDCPLITADRIIHERRPVTIVWD
jgi:PIN domain nuclease of toxin-antitoxin system